MPRRLGIPTIVLDRQRVPSERPDFAAQACVEDLVSIRDELLKRINKRQEGMAVLDFRVHIPRTVDEQLERLPSDILWNLEKHLEVMAQLAAEAPESDSVWAKLKDEDSGNFRFESRGIAVFFELDRCKRVLMVARLKQAPIAGTQRA